MNAQSIVTKDFRKNESEVGGERYWIESTSSLLTTRPSAKHGLDNTLPVSLFEFKRLPKRILVVFYFILFG